MQYTLRTDGCYHFGDTVEVKGNVFAYISGPGLIKVLKKMSCTLNYFECEIVSGGKQPAIGVGIGDFACPLDCVPGLGNNGIFYRSDGKLYNSLRFCGSSYALRYGPVCGVGDRLGCGVELPDGRVNVFFTVNGKVVCDLISFKNPDSGLHPLIGMYRKGDQVKYLGQRHYHSDKIVNKIMKTKVTIRECELESRCIRSEPSSKVRPLHICFIYVSL